MNIKNITKLKRLISRHVKAEVELSWIGSSDPEDREAIRHAADLAKEKLNEFIESELTDNPA